MKKFLVLTTSVFGLLAAQNFPARADAALDQLEIFGGLGVTRGHIAEKLYREIRALRIYEGASEVQKLVIATRLLAEFKG
jgi:alkylation response protein AidB-like acyl-CoA dehydrogenase